MTDTTEPQPVRKSSLPCTPPPEFEFHTWFPLPDGGGDLVPGQRDRGVHVRRLVTYGDWEPVHPGRWADEPESDAASVVVPAADRAALRDRIAGAIRAAACAGGCEQTEEQCARTRIQPFVWHHGVLAEVSGPVDVIADAILSVLPAPADRAAVLTEAAEAVAALDRRKLGIVADTTKDAWEEGRDEGVDLLRRMAVESAAVDRVAAETPEPKTGCAHCGGPHDWADCEAYTALADAEPGPAVEAQPGKDTETPQPKEA